jgi:hypothetical protein
MQLGRGNEKCTHNFGEETMENDYLEDKEEYETISLRYILREQVVRAGGRWIWLRNVSNGGLRYQRCYTLRFYHKTF